MKSVINQVSISGITSCLPTKRLSVFSFEDLYSNRAELAQIVKNTGISEVREAAPEICSSDLCFVAGRALMRELNVQPDSIDGLIFVSQTPDYRLPPTSTILQDRFGMRKDTATFDLNFGCSGYVNGLFFASSLIGSGACKRVLLLAGDVIRRFVHPKDRSLLPLFGDAGTATLVERTDSSSSISFSLFSDGSGAHQLIVPGGGCRKPSSLETQRVYFAADGVPRTEDSLYMNGMEVMNFVMREIPKAVEDILLHCSWKKEAVSCFVFHQANRFILEYLAKKIKLPKEKVPISIENVGNTGPASIPLTLCLEAGKLDLRKSVLCGFGVGLSWATACLDLSSVKHFNVVDYESEAGKNVK